jgi:retron-type reverse transcriptase
VPDRDYRLALLRVPHLPQGAPTSPALANLCGFRLDRRLAGLAAVYHARYTRYADDLAFSGSFSKSGAARFVVRASEVVADEGFRLNAAKTRIRGRGDRQALAGLVVNSAPAVPRQEYDALRALLHNASHTGIEEQNRDGHADFVAYLAGRIAWVGHQHPARAAKLRALFAQALAS